jgi:transposase
MKGGLSLSKRYYPPTINEVTPKGPQERRQPLKTYYIGMDIHHKKTMYVIMDEPGNVIDRGSINTNRDEYAGMLARNKVPQDTKVGFESGEKMYWATTVLIEVGMTPIAINAHEVRAKARRPNQKSDHRDAFEICDGLRRGIYTSIVYVPTPEVQKLRRILSRRRFFVKEGTRQLNGARFLLRRLGMGDRKRPGLAKDGDWEKLLKSKEHEEIRGHLSMHYEMWKVARKLVAELDGELAEAGKPFKVLLKLLQTMPGVGPITSVAYVAAIGDISRFRTAAEGASYLGLVPSTFDSGERERHGHITKRGPSYVRSLLCECAHHAAKVDHPLHAFWKRRMVRSGYKKAVTAVSHRMAKILFAMWKNNEKFDPEKLRPVEPVKKPSRNYRLKRAA